MYVHRVSLLLHVECDKPGRFHRILDSLQNWTIDVDLSRDEPLATIQDGFGVLVYQTPGGHRIGLLVILLSLFLVSEAYLKTNAI